MLKMEENMQHFSILCFIISRKVETQLKHTHTKICAVYGEGAMTDWTRQKWLQTFLVLLTHWPNNSLLWGCLMHQKMFRSTPGPYPLEANSGRSWHTQNVQINKVIGENKKYAFYFIGEKYRHFGQPNIRNLVASFIMKNCLTVPEIRSKQGSGQKSEMSHNEAKIKVSAWLHFSQEAFRDNPLPCPFQFLEAAQSTWYSALFIHIPTQPSQTESLSQVITLTTCLSLFSISLV